jgi:hypothetical protein
MFTPNFLFTTNDYDTLYSSRSLLLFHITHLHCLLICIIFIYWARLMARIYVSIEIVLYPL